MNATTRASVGGRRAPVYRQSYHRAASLADGRTVGEFVSESRGVVLLKRVDPEAHQLWSPPAWCIDGRHYRELLRRRAWGVRLLATDGDVWEATLSDFELHGWTFERRHGEQRGLPMQWWTRHPKGARQLGLFEVAS